MGDKYLIAAIFGASSIEATSDHPNELNFSGVLVRLDEPSTKPPNGSRGHKILIPKALAEKRYKTLVGMGVNYASDLDAHAPTRKVGVIKKAWIEGNAIKVSGVIWKKDFPDAEKDLKKSNLGMSFEASDISVEEDSAPVWVLSDLCFTGAAILYKDAAAYYKTEALAASAGMSAQLIKKNNGGETMAKVSKTSTPTTVAASGDDAQMDKLIKALVLAQKPVLDAINANTSTLVNLQASMEASKVADVEAKAKKALKDDESDDEDGDEEDDEEAAAENDEEAAADEVAAGEEEGDLEDLDEDNHDEDQTPGHFSDDIDEGKGDKTTVSTKKDKHKSVKAGADLTSLTETVNELAAARQADKKELKSLRAQLARQTKQIEAAGDRTERRSISISAGLQSLLAKQGIDANEMSASGSKMTAEEFDMCAGKSGMSITQRVAYKTEAARIGVMDEGIVRRA